MAAGCVIGVDLGGTKLLAGVVGADHSVHARVRREVAGLSQAALLDEIVDAVGELSAAAPEGPLAAGLGIPCTVDRARGVAVASVHLPLNEVAVRDLVAERAGLPVALDNDANAATLVEHRRGVLAGAEDALLLTIGTGIGGGIVIGGRLYRGARGAAAELGHLVVDLDGERCRGACGGLGCLETVASGTALGREGARMAGERPRSALGRAAAGGRDVTGALVTELAHDGDLAAIAAVGRVGERLGVGVTSLVNAFDPEVVAIGGGAIAAGDLLLDPVRAVVRERALPPARDEVRVVEAAFGPEAGMLGAAELAFDAVAARGTEA